MTTTSGPLTSSQQVHSLLNNEGCDDVATDFPDVFRTHRKLDRSISEPHTNALLTRSVSQSGSQSGSSASSRYKTELCRPYEENGSCKYGEKCQFAHGRHELRTVARHPKYKTDLCKTYHTTGLCPYGPRCHFIHNDEERYLNLINRYLLQQQMADTMIEKAQLVQKQQAIMAALATQKALQQQQQQGPSSPSSRKPTLRQTSSDPSADHSRLPFPFVAVDPLSASLSDSSSVSDSPTPSPTSSMFSDDHQAALTSLPSSIASAFPPSSQFGGQPEAKRFPMPYVGGHQPQQTSDQTSTSSCLLLLAQLQASSLSQQEIFAILEYLVQKGSSSPSPFSSAAATAASSSNFSSFPFPNSPGMSPFSAHSSFTPDFASRDSNCFSYQFPTVEL